MTIIWHYSTPTTPAGTGSDVVINGAVEVSSRHQMSESAALGDASIVSVTVDDPDGAYNFRGLKRVYAIEDACPDDDHYAFNSYVGRQTISRGKTDVTFPVAAGRQWDLELVETNAILEFRVIWDTDGNRPAETAAARLTWLLASDYLSTVHDNGLVVYPTDDLDANDYRGQFAHDVLNDLANQTGYIFFAFYEQDVGQISLFFDLPDSLTYLSTISLSNVQGDVDDSSTFSAIAELERDPSRVAAGVMVQYGDAGAAVYHFDLATSYEFGFRDRVAPVESIKTSGKADTLAIRYLAENNDQDEKVMVDMTLPASMLTAVKRGQVISSRWQHIPGWEEFRDARVMLKSWAPPDNQSQLEYDVHLELVPIGTSDTVLACLASNPLTGTADTATRQAWIALALQGTAIAIDFPGDSAYGPAPDSAVPLPVFATPGDLMLLIVETSHDAINTPAGWAAVANSPQGVGTHSSSSAVQISVFWRRFTGTETPPAIAFSTTGDHWFASIQLFHGVRTSGNPWSASAGGIVDAPDTAVSLDTSAWTATQTAGAYVFGMIALPANPALTWDANDACAPLGDLGASSTVGGGNPPYDATISFFGGQLP